MKHIKTAYLAGALLLVIGVTLVQASVPAGAISAANDTGAQSVSPAGFLSLPRVFGYERTFGETEVAYFADTAHLYNPEGVGVDGAGNLWVAETLGARVLKYSGDGIPIILSGIVPEPMSMFEAIDKMGGVVVADDLACCGRRLYPPGHSEEAFSRMAERILTASPDPTRGSPIRDRLAHLLRLVETCGAKGVVFYDVKFCEPELFDLPTLRKELQTAGVPSVAIEVDLNDPLSQQVLTRLEAFVEMIA
jgi:hypothetical protein